MTESSPGLALGLAGQLAQARLKSAFQAVSLKPPHGYVLLLLSGQGVISQQSLAETVGVDPSVLVSILNDLEGDGLVQRRRDPADRRRHIVEITANGKARAAEVRAAVAEAEAAIFRDLAPGELETLNTLLERVAGSMRCSGDDIALEEGC